jgi:hypothetical protein
MANLTTGDLKSISTLDPAIEIQSDAVFPLEQTEAGQLKTLKYTRAQLIALLQAQITAGTIVSFGSDRNAIASPVNNQIFFDVDDGIAYQYATGGGWTAKLDFVTSAEMASAIAGLLTQAAADARYVQSSAIAGFITQTTADGRYLQLSNTSETIDDRVAALLVAGSNISLTYNDLANTLTIASTASSGGGGGNTGLQYTYSTTAGTGVISASSLSTATTLTLGTPDAQSGTVSDVLARLKFGAIIEVAKDSSNRVRYAVTSNYASGSVGVAVAAVYGAISTEATVYLRIESDAPATATGTGFSAGTITGVGGNTTATISQATAPSGSTRPGNYTYAWYRSTTANFLVGSGTLVSGATSSTLADTGLTNGTTYYYTRVVTDVLGNKAATPEISVATDAAAATPYTYVKFTMTANQGNSVFGTNEFQAYSTVGGANILTGGTPFGSLGFFGSTGLAQTFDGVFSSIENGTASNAGFPFSIGYQMAAPAVIAQVGFSALYGRSPLDAGDTTITGFIISGSNDGINYTTLLTVTNATAPAAASLNKYIIP